MNVIQVLVKMAPFVLIWSMHFYVTAQLDILVHSVSKILVQIARVNQVHVVMVNVN
jgi:hypothetical protein